MILNSRNPIPMDVLIETDPEQAGKLYGLDSSNAITVEMWQIGEDEPKMSFLVGNDAGQGTSFVRISGDKSVYRANVGGRRRFAHSASDWLNQRVFQLQMSELATVEVDSESHPVYTLQNGESWICCRGDKLVTCLVGKKHFKTYSSFGSGAVVSNVQSIDTLNDLY